MRSIVGACAVLVAMVTLLVGCDGGTDDPSPAPDATSSGKAITDKATSSASPTFPKPKPKRAAMGAPFTATVTTDQGAHTLARIKVTEVTRMPAEEQAKWSELSSGSAWVVRVSATNLGDDTTLAFDGLSNTLSLVAGRKQSKGSGYQGSIAPMGCLQNDDDTAWPGKATVKSCSVQVMPEGVEPESLIYFSYAGEKDGEPTFATVTVPLP